MKTQRLTEDDLKQYKQYNANMRKIKVGNSKPSAAQIAYGRSLEPLAQACLASHATISLSLALTGQLPSGKNQVQLLFRNGKVHKYPNKTFTNWRSRSHIQIEEQELPAVRHPTITSPVHLTVEYWPGDALTRDVSGQLDALFHLLVYAKVLKDDGLVHDVTWRRQPMNRKFPKVFLTIEVILRT